MLKFKVTPISLSGNEAPYYVIDVSRDVKDPEQQAINQARSQSRLADFNYLFSCSQIFKKKK